MKPAMKERTIDLFGTVTRRWMVAALCLLPVACTEDETTSLTHGRSASQPQPLDAGTDAAAGAAGAAGTDAAAGAADDDIASWTDARVQSLISQMTLAEKISQLQHNAPAIERLNLPAYNYWNEALHGVLVGGATSFPQAIALGSTWNPELVKRVATAISDEARGFNVRDGKGLTYWSPVVNMLRDPRWGRYEESYSEDPYLMSELAVAFVQGLQGDDPKYLKAVSTPKHFVANNSEINRHTGSSDVDEQTLHEYYLPAFQAAVKTGHAFSVMAAYNSLNGTPCSANPLLLQDLLRTQWGFHGYVVSDCGAISDIVNGHHWVSSLSQAAGMAVRAGTDLNCGSVYPSQLQRSLDEGWAAESDIDTALARVLRARFVLGEFDPPTQVPYRAIDPSVIESPSHGELALEAARDAIVLLKNDSAILPLDRSKISNIAVIGPHSNDAILGGYSGSPSHSVTPLGGITAKLAGEGDVTITHVQGCSILGEPDPESIAAAADAAAAADVAVVFAGTSLEIMSEERDRADWNLPAVQETLLEAVYAANPMTVLVLITGGPLAVDWADAHVPAIMTAFYDGQEQGTAIADVLFGDAEPKGRLSATWYQGTTVLPPIEDYDIRKGRTYLYLADAPLYAFGHGLSYTSFEYGDLQLESASIDANGTAEMSVEVTNTGGRAGEDVVQLYSHDVDADQPRPYKQLRRFQRVHLDAGASTTISFTLPAVDLARYDISVHGWRIHPGQFDLYVGASSMDVRGHAILTVE